jgi:hypothetical protein
MLKSTHRESLYEAILELGDAHRKEMNNTVNTYEVKLGKVIAELNEWKTKAPTDNKAKSTTAGNGS